jgi:60 kDa SS-A/Ro ribonucleoprotein
MNYSKHTSTKTTPPSEPILGSNQVKNNAGGYAFPVLDRVQLERFLTLGTEGGTYYVKENKLTKDNAKTIVAMIQRDGVEVVNVVVEFTKSNRAPKQDPALFVLALVCTFGEQRAKNAAYAAIATVARTSTHLFTFCQAIQDMRGWSRGLRSGVNRWYESKTTDQVAYQMAKYRQRNGWTHRDVLRLAHPKPADPARATLYAYAVGKEGMKHGLPQVIEAFEKAQVTTNVLELAKLVSDFGLTWEMIPTEMLNQPVILDALLQHMPLTAMMRNLNRYAQAGMTTERTAPATQTISKALRNQRLLIQNHIHPVNVLNTYKTYSQGHGFRGGKTWTPSPELCDALQDAFEQSFHSVESTEKKVLVAVDVSGSMSAQISNMALTCQEAAAALAMTYLRREPNAEIIYFDTGVHIPTVGKRSSYKEVLADSHHRGGTDCSVPFRYALQRVGHKFDAIVLLTDSETWAGDRHPVQAYAQYKTKINPATKGVCVGMVANGVGLFPDSDPLALNVSGFDAAIPTLLNNFLAD